MIKKLKRFRMRAVCIREIKWFGSDVYEVDGFTVMHSGHELPLPGDVLQRGEGVAIVS